MPVDPKPPARHVDRHAGKEKVRREGRCRIKGCTYIGAFGHVSRFHLVGRDLGGDDIDDNIIPICAGHHDFWEHGPEGKQGLGPAIWSSLYEWEASYVLEKKGVDYVRRYYGVDLLG